MQLQISPNGRRIVRADGTPFFYLADTAWNLFYALTREEADFYLQTRAAQGFTAIQSATFFELGPPDEPNRYGHGPVIKGSSDPTQLNEPFFEHVDFVVRRANELGLVMAFGPTWGDKWNRVWGVGPEIWTPKNAQFYGQFLGNRYKNDSIIWFLGGDRKIEKPEHLEIMRGFARGIREGNGGAHLITFHPQGGYTSATMVHDEEWLDFNMLQTGHAFPGDDNGAKMRADWAKTPTKPFLDGEPRYEDHPIMGSEWEAPFHGYFETQHIRAAAYEALLNGACGHTYGCHDVWPFFGSPRFEREPRNAINGARTSWQQALFLPGATQMRFAKTLLESLDWMHFEPRPEMVISCDTRIAAGATNDGKTALFYFPRRVYAALDLKNLVGQNLQTRWFDPQTGLYETPTVAPRPKWSRSPDNTRIVYVPPREGDWVLRIDAE